MSATSVVQSAWMRRIGVGCDFTYVADVDTPVIVQVQPMSTPTVSIIEQRWSTTPSIPLRSYTDIYGNPCTRTVLPPGLSRFSYDAVALCPDGPEDIDLDAPEIAPDALPDHTLLYTLPSRFCLPDVLGDEAWSRFGAVAPGYRRVRAICQHVHDHLRFQYGSSTAWTTAADVNSSQLGVCRDFTHLAISFCRALNIPARYVFGYLPDLDGIREDVPMDFAAWMEVWLGDRWWTFDPRNNTPRAGRVLIGCGRDASDVAMATTFGGPWLQEMVVRAAE